MAALCNRAGHIFVHPVVSSSFFLIFSSPNLSGRRLDVYHTSTHSVNLECRSETCCTRLAENTARKKITKKSPSGHHPITMSSYIFATKACIDNRKKLLSSNISSTRSHNVVNFGPLAAEICWRVWGTPANFNGFRARGVTARHSSSGCQPNLRR